MYTCRSELRAVLLHQRGVSMIDKEEQVFHDPNTDQALLQTLKGGQKSFKIRVISLDNNINDEAFARAVVESLIVLIEEAKT